MKDYICDKCGINDCDFMSICEPCKRELNEISRNIGFDGTTYHIKQLLDKMPKAKTNEDLSKLHKKVNRLFNEYIGDMVENIGRKEEEKEVKVVDLMARIELKKKQMEVLAKEVEHNLSQYVNQTEEQKKLLEALQKLESGVVDSVSFNSLVDPNLCFEVRRKFRP